MFSGVGKKTVIVRPSTSTFFYFVGWKEVSISMELDTKMDRIYLPSTSLEGLSSRRWKRVCLHVAMIDGDCMSLKLRVVGLTCSRIAKYNRNISEQDKKGADRNCQKKKV